MWKKIGAGAVLLAGVAAGLGFWGPFRSHERSLRLPGVVEIQEVRLGSKIGGRVEKVWVMEGDRVEAGAPLVTFEAPELKAQRDQLVARLEQARLDYKKAKDGYRPQEVEAARASMESAKARYDKLVAGPRKEEIDTARADWKAADADLKLARQDWERAERLYGTNSISRAEYQLNRAAMERHEGRTRSAKAKLDLLVAGYRKEEVAEGKAEYERMKASHEMMKEGTRAEDILVAQQKVAELEGKLRETDANLAEAVVRAPESVIVEVLAVRKGDLVTANQPILRVLRDADLWVKVYVPETELDKVRLDQEVEVTIDAGTKFQGRVMKIASESEFTPRNVQSADERRHQVFGVKIEVKNPRGVIKPGMAAEVVIPYGAK
jgi:multidrug resistance efflux pump